MVITGQINEFLKIKHSYKKVLFFIDFSKFFIVVFRCHYSPTKVP